VQPKQEKINMGKLSNNTGAGYLENAIIRLEGGLMNNLRGPILIILLYGMLTYHYKIFERTPLLYLVVNRGFPRTWFEKELKKIGNNPTVVRPLDTIQSVTEK
jgi:hypothetical protein